MMLCCLKACMEQIQTLFPGFDQFLLLCCQQADWETTFLPSTYLFICLSHLNVLTYLSRWHICSLYHPCLLDLLCLRKRSEPCSGFDWCCPDQTTVCLKFHSWYFPFWLTATANTFWINLSTVLQKEFQPVNPPTHLFLIVMLFYFKQTFSLYLGFICWVCV